MLSQSLTRAIDCLREAPTEAEMWAEFLPLVAHGLDAAGSACLSFNTSTNSIEWAYRYGPTAAHKIDYVEQYAAHDVFWPVLAAAGQDKWITLSRSLPQDVLRQSPWYQEFVVPSGVTDVLGAHVFQAGTSQIFFGMHYEPGKVPVSEKDVRLLALRQHIGRAAELGHARRTLKLRESLGRWMLEQHDDALIIADSMGRVIKMSGAAERLLASNRTLHVGKGRFTAFDSADASRLSSLMERAGQGEPRRVLLGSVGRTPRHLITIVPLVSFDGGKEAQILIRIRNLPVEQGSADDIADLFDLTPAERRLSLGILDGKTLSEMTQEFGVAMPTLRAQLQTIFRKCGVQRQVDLVRLFLTIR